MSSHDDQYKDEISVSSDDQLSSSKEHTGSDAENGTRTRSSDDTPLAYKETLVVNRSKLMVYLALSLAAAAVGTITYIFLAKGDTDSFQNQFQSTASQVYDAAETNAINTGSVLTSLATTITSIGVHDHVEWPLFSLPDYERHCQSSRAASGAEMIAMAPVVVGFDQTKFEAYANASQGWIQESLDYLGWTQIQPGPIPTNIIANETSVVRGVKSFLPLWQISPPPRDASLVMTDLQSIDWVNSLSKGALQIGRPILSKLVDVDFLLERSDEEGSQHPRSVMMNPFYHSFQPNAQVAGYILAVLPWESYFQNLLPDGTPAYIVNINDGCGSDFSYRIAGKESVYLGHGDLHEGKYDHLVYSAEFASFARFDAGSVQNVFNADDKLVKQVNCHYVMSVYPTSDLESAYKTKNPVRFSVIVVSVFLFTALVFACYDYAVQYRQRKVLNTAQRTAAIVTSMFPKNVQQRILAEVENEVHQDEKARRGLTFGTATRNLKKFLDDGDDMGQHTGPYGSKPIADLFPEVTIMFADMVGFTAWSSTREPSQVFMLLETVYYAFDEIAQRRRVFKVETVGDCYVAVAGLPDPRKDHAIVMARFARDCLVKIDTLLKNLEEILGPDTADLSMRVGLHSGPVTAGVLRGERARFQLFGDTVNTCSRMESTSEPNKIQVSAETANLLIKAGKTQWLRPRQDKVHAKGKGEMVTYWLDLRGNSAASTKSGSSDDTAKDDDPRDKTSPEYPLERSTGESRHDTIDLLQDNMTLSDKYIRLVNWNSELLAGLLRQIIARREATNVDPDPLEHIRLAEELIKDENHKSLALDEVVEVITLPSYDADAGMAQQDPRTVQLSEEVVRQLKLFVQTIAMMYRDNPFHNYAHASHVTMSVIKLLGRIVAPTHLDQSHDGHEKQLHDHTYGITSDPLTQFAVVVAALIHDVDHPGVSNAQLVKEKAPLAHAYLNRSVAEQNSLDIAWNLLMDDSFEDLRRAIYNTQADLKRFRQLMVNAVMATDIMDKDLADARKARWNLAFAEGYQQVGEALQGPACEMDVNRKATIVMEHLIQASDVAHTMQHWQVYIKWNRLLFMEMSRAFRDGRMGKDPAEFWYEGELGFFDSYVIPLAKKLKDCGVFGVSSDEYLDYAQHNRVEWEQKGREMLAEMMEAARDSTATFRDD